MMIHHNEPDCLLQRLVVFFCLQGQGHIEGSHNQNMTFKHIFITADPFATKVRLMAHYRKLDGQVKRLDCSFVVRVKVTGRVQNSSECSSE